ncbi:guanyl-nucleotide exchange factor [Schizosaccharomyces japonicus yFS275]|uniref:Guanyl-nucleotide exchange factor n=1 Tax=Schizosaccharomyces japonicus (strain yFS275 / FY16936) TaxID=402676 RepID=B6JXK1_SCHJY|nr:guanyl-nucleotide exchange factor [Schizosaccharomyces japonicus yFS275]EEB05145.1 guanyl-nucleotide exchange factor [Schizosaccharomyces japonicus yFS275]
MYVPNGVPQYLELYCYPLRILKLRKNPVFVVLTQSDILIYQTHPISPLFCFKKPKASVLKHGSNNGLAFDSDSMTIAVSTDKNYVVLFRLQFDVEEQSLRPSSSKTVPMEGPGECLGTIKCVVRHSLTLRYDSGISCIFARKNVLLCAAKNVPVLNAAHYNANDSNDEQKQKVLTKAIDFSQQSWYISKDTHIQKLFYDESMGLFLFVTANGFVYTCFDLFSQLKTNDDKKGVNGICVHNPNTEYANDCLGNATAISVNSKFSLAYVGTEKGYVCAYQIRDFGRTFVLSRIHKPCTTVQPVFHLDTSPDGFQLLAGFGESWFTYTPYLRPVSNNTSFGSGSFGVVDGFWDLDGTSYCCLEQWKPIANDDGSSAIAPVARTASSTCMTIIPFLRNTIACGVQTALHLSALHTTDRIFIPNTYYTYASDVDNFGVNSWKQVEYPPDYICLNWPIRHVAFDRAGEYVAIAGRYGFAYCKIHANKWKMFHDELAEQSFTVTGGMVWYHNFLVCAVRTGNGLELQLYSRDRDLLIENIQSRLPVTAPILTISRDGPHLLAYTSDNTLYHVQIVVERGSGKLQFVSKEDFNNVFPTPYRIRSLSWFLPDYAKKFPPKQFLSYAIFIILIDGKLIILTSDKKGTEKSVYYQSYILCKNVEFYLYNDKETHEEASLYTHSLWAITADGLKVWLNFYELLHVFCLKKNTAGDNLGSIEEDVSSNFDKLQLSSPPLTSEVLVSSDATSDRYTHSRSSSSIYFGPNSPLPKTLTDFQAETEMRNRAIVLNLTDSFMSILLINGLLMSYTSDYRSTNTSGLSYANVEVSVKPFVPSLALGLLKAGEEAESIKILSMFRDQSYGTYLLEMMLQQVVVSQEEGNTTWLLSSVARVLERFPKQKWNVVANCIRKIEMKFWPSMFKVFGQPTDIFQNALQEDNILAAQECLLVLHVHDGISKHCKEMLQLLQQVQQQKQTDVMNGLIDYLSMLDVEGVMSNILRQACKTMQSSLDSGMSTEVCDQYTHELEARAQALDL